MDRRQRARRRSPAGGEGRTLRLILRRCWLSLQKDADQCTKPCLTGSPATNTIGIVAVACFAARAEALPPVATSTFTRRCTNSAANAGSRPYSPRAQRYSMVTFWPSKKPASPRPLRNARNTGPVSSGERALKNPITGLAACCARTENGHVTAVQPKSVMNSRRLIASPEAQDKASHRTKLAYWKGLVERPGKCPLWVKSGHVRRKRRCPLYPQTCAVQLAMSATGHKRTSCLIRSPRRRVIEPTEEC